MPDRLRWSGDGLPAGPVAACVRAGERAAGGLLGPSGARGGALRGASRSPGTRARVEAYHITGRRNRRSEYAARTRGAQPPLCPHNPPRRTLVHPARRPGEGEPRCGRAWGAAIARGEKAVRRGQPNNPLWQHRQLRSGTQRLS